MASQSKAIKMVALRLINLHWSDRRWVLSQLDAATAAQIRQQLHELKTMGVSNGADLYQQFSEEALSRGPEQSFSRYLQQKKGVSTEAFCWLMNKSMQNGQQI
ncbi:MAG TPA: hypothetical protein DF774_08395 [Rheinheimera sp.]|uniref:hypothetical protein n=1 Tax=Rheinheimera sp. TaxID=1869214 RepID=UPI000EF07691|nr:hypothetical protein [Rheinheimera sp.]HCU65764.1 hypothetical protein [Rheinheimera sp.]